MGYFHNKEVKRGDIFYVAHSKCYATNPSLDAGRPAVVVSNDTLNKSSDCVEIVYLTSKEKKPMNTHANVICKVPSTALCETIYTVNKDRLGDFVRSLTDKEMAEINRGILNSLGISVEREETPSDLQSALTERDVYKKMYESLLDKVVSA